MTDVDGMIRNARAGACMCGRTDGVLYGPHPFGYGPCCVACQQEWSRMHGGARWKSNEEMLCLLRAEHARARADGRPAADVVNAWNRGTGLFERPRQTAPLSARWQAEYDAWQAKTFPIATPAASVDDAFTTPVDQEDIPF